MPGVRRRLRVAPRTHVWLAASALEAMLTEADRYAPLETGGMLLGYCSPDTDPEQLMVEAILGPGPHAAHARELFEPDARWQQAQLTEAYRSSGRITTYLGDWHTHPGSSPAASRRDRRTASRVARTRSARMPSPLILILGMDPLGENQWTAMTYRWQSRRLAAVTLEVLDA